MPSRTRDQHLFDEGPKRILALDGGGVRGILTLQLLRRIEALLRERCGGDEHFRLCDYFDLIGGTSTGAIIAAGLAMGYSVARLDELYRELGRHVFKNDWFRFGVLRAKFSDAPLRAVLDAEFGSTTLGDARVRTGLAIMLKRIDTGSPWIVHNNPRGRYFEPRQGSKAVANSRYLLKNVVRASTAAPHYFDPERIEVAADMAGAFVDGGVSPHNNPALQLLLLATLKGYGLGWPVGADRLLLVSVGTGSWELRLDASAVIKMAPLALAARSLASLMGDAAALNELLLQWLSVSPTARQIDREVGDLCSDVFGAREPWLTYLRYDAQLEQGWLKNRLGLDLAAPAVEALREMDDPQNLDALARLGEATAMLVKDEHFGACFDI